MKKVNPLQGYTATPGTTNSYWFMGALLTFFATEKETQGQFALFQATVGKNYDVPPHTHEREDESFYIVEGTMECTVGDDTFHAKAGDFIFLPRKVQHSWRTASEPVKFLVWVTPGGYEKAFLQLSQPAAAMELPTEPVSEEMMQRAVALDNEYGVFYAFQKQG